MKGKIETQRNQNCISEMLAHDANFFLIQKYGYNMDVNSAPVFEFPCEI